MDIVVEISYAPPRAARGKALVQGVIFVFLFVASAASGLARGMWAKRKLRDYFLRPLARLTNRVSPRGYQTYDWEE